VVAFGGFGSVLGSLYAGLIIGLIQAASGFWLGVIYKDVVVYALFVGILWVRPEGLMGARL
jgi:branched-chain amino acid transport system permease protein